jgi:hypothetical protein
VADKGKNGVSRFSSADYGKRDHLNEIGGFGRYFL